MSRDEQAPAAQPEAAAPALRASHEERDQVVELLRVAAGDGRLTAEELDERLEAALTARTQDELVPLLRDLPSAGAVAGAVAVAGTGARAVAPSIGPAPEVTRLRAHRSNVERTGPWTVPLRLEVDVRSANAQFDFTQAVIAHPVLELELTARSSNVRLVVPPGVVVTLDDLEVSSSSVRQRVHPQLGAPALLVVRVSGAAHSSNVEVRGPRNGLMARLRARREERRAARTAQAQRRQALAA